MSSATSRNQFQHLLLHVGKTVAGSGPSKTQQQHRELLPNRCRNVLASKNETVLAHVAADPREVLGCNTRADLAEVDSIFRERKRVELMNEGVSIQLPETVLIDPDVTVGEDTVLEPCVQLLGKTKIGLRCSIRTAAC